MSINYKSIRVPEAFINDIKEVAEKEHRSIPQQIMYWTEIGKQAELREWQLEKMRKGLSQAKSGLIVQEEEMQTVFEELLKKCQ